MPDLFGAPAGISAAEADQRAQDLHVLSMAEGGIKLQQALLTLQQQKAMLGQMQQAFGGDGGGKQTPFSSSMDLGDQLYSLSTMAMRAGMPDKAAEYARAGSQVKYQATEIQKTQSEAQVKEADLIGRIMSGVVDQQSWIAANQMIQQQTGKPSRWAQRPYDPRLVASIVTTSQSIKDRALTRAAETRADANEADAQEHRARLGLIDAQKRITNDRDAALYRDGATGKIPKSADLKAITDLIKRDYPGVPDEDARVLGRPAAERMLDLMKRQRLTQSEAANRAYEEFKEQGTFGGIRPGRVIPGSGKAKPLDLPMSDGKLDRSKLRDNMWYNVKGQPMLLMKGKLYSEDELSQIEADDQADEPANANQPAANPDDTAPAKDY